MKIITGSAIATAAFVAVLSSFAFATGYSVTGTATMSTSAASAPAICKKNSGVSQNGVLNNLSKSACNSHDTCTSAKALATSNLTTHLNANGMSACTKYMSSTPPCSKTC